MKKIVLYISCIILSAVLLSQAYSQEWVKTYKNLTAGIKDGEDKGNAMVIDSEGFIIVTGFVTGITTGKDIIIIKYKPDGDTLWTRVYSGEGMSEDKAYAITVDEMDNIYITGHITGTSVYSDIVTIKYSPAGVLQWAGSFNGSAGTNDAGKVICADNSNNIYVAGYTTGTSSGSDYILIKYNSAGVMQWNKTFNGTGSNTDEVTAIAVNNGITDCEDYVVITGFSSSGQTESTENVVTIVYKEQNGAVLWTKTFNRDPGNLQDKAYAITVDNDNAIYITGFTTTSSTGKDIFTIKYDYEGSLKWTKYYSGNYSDAAFKIVSASNNNILVCGYTQTTSQAGSEDFITLNYHSNNGNLKWQNILNGPGNSSDEATNMILSKNSQYIYVTGNSNAGGSSSRYDILTIKYKIANGTMQDSTRFNSNGFDENNPKSIAIDEDGNIYISGFSSVNNSLRQATSIIRNSYILTLKYSENNFSSFDKMPEGLSSGSIIKLNQNFPNPFNPSTLIEFNLAFNSFVTLKVYDLLGKEVAVLVNEYLTAGTHAKQFNSGNLSSGIYLYELNANGVKDIKKMILIK